jgi:hypothetical protein
MRAATNKDIKKYERMVNMYLKKYVVKNWNEASMSKSNQDIMLGNTGMTMEDIKQHLMIEVCIAISKYNPDYETKEGRSVLESTFVYQHLFNRTGQLMKRLTKKRYGYGMWMSEIQHSSDEDGENKIQEYGIDYTDDFLNNIDEISFKKDFMNKVGKDIFEYYAFIKQDLKDQKAVNPHYEAVQIIKNTCDINDISIPGVL